MRVVFIGCVTFSEKLLKALLQHPDAEIVGVVTKESSAINADFRDLSPLAAAHGIPCFSYTAERRGTMPSWIRELSPDVVYCFGWSYLLSPEVLGIARLGAVGYHPAALPSNRGRHPIIWALALGLAETASTFFFMDEGADSGDIIDQERVAISPEDDAGSLYGKLMGTAGEQLLRLTTALAQGTHSRKPQAHDAANYWRKRSPRDGAIDWRMPSRGVHNLVRALTRPYPGAHLVSQGQEVKVWKTELADADFPGIENLEPGKVLASEESGVAVKCGIGAVRLVEHELPFLPEPGSYL